MKRQHSEMTQVGGGDSGRTYVVVPDSPALPSTHQPMEGVTMAAVVPPSQPSEQAAPSVATRRESNAAHLLRPTARSLIGEQFASLRSDQASLRRKALLTISRALPFSNVAQSSKLVEVLVQQMGDEAETDIKSLLASTLASVAVGPDVHAEPVVVVLLQQLKDKSGKVRAQILRSLQQIARGKLLSTTMLERGLESALKQLDSDHHRVRREALLLLSHLCPIDPDSSTRAQSILSNFTHDTDFRVRMAAFEGALVLHGRGVALDVDMFYWHAIHALDDDYEEVRTQALHLIWVLSNMYGEHMVSAKGKAYSSEMLRLVDDGFMKICNMVMDPSIKVRRLACKLLGSIKNVRTSYLLQTLSKEVISAKGGSSTNRAARSQASARNRALPTVEGLSYLAGTAIGEMELDMENFVLSDSGAAGAFIHGLEDEFFEVRMAAVDSICELSLRSRHLASRALEYLVDMFNDEIEEVRVNTIESVHKILHKVDLKEEQIKLMQPILEEANEGIRIAMYNLIGAIKCPNVGCLHETINSLLRNMTRYPEDRLSIYQCLKGLGKHHGQFVELLVEPLLASLHFDLRFLGAELHMEDSTYVALAIVILNAGADNSNILSLLPSFIARHHRFFRDKYPGLFPVHLPFPSLPNDTTPLLSAHSSSPQLASTASPHHENTAQFFSEVLSNISRVVNLLHASRYEEARRLIQVSSRDLNRVAEVDAQRQANAKFYLLYLRGLSIIIQTHSGTGGNKDLAGELLSLTYRLEHEYIGLAAPVLVQIRRLRLYARLLLLSSPDTATALVEEAEEADEPPEGANEEMVQHVRRGLEDLRSFCEERRLELPSDLLALLREDALAQGSSSLLSTLLPRESVHVEGGILKRVWADWIRPVENPEKPVSFPSSLYLPVHIEALLHNVVPDSPIFLYVTLPDLTSQVWPLRAGELRPLGGNRARLSTTINLYVHQHKWTEGCNIGLDLVMGFDLDVPSTDLRHTSGHVRSVVRGQQQPATTEEWKGPPTPAQKRQFQRSGLIRLCPTHSYVVLPLAK